MSPSAHRTTQRLNERTEAPDPEMDDLEMHDHAWRVVSEVHSRGHCLRLVYRCDLCTATWTTSRISSPWPPRRLHWVPSGHATARLAGLRCWGGARR